MRTPTNKNDVLIPEVSSDIGLSVAARGSAISTVATPKIFSADELTVAPLSRNGSLNQGLDSEATRHGGGGGEERIAILYENHQWLEGLFRELDFRGLPYHAINLDDAALFLDAPDDYPLVINRVSPSSYLRGHGSAIRLATGWLEMLERSGKRVINGAASFKVETSKVAQHLLIRSLGLSAPKTAVFNNREAIRPLLHRFPFPAILKPDTGGSGAYIRYVPSREYLEYLLKDEDKLFGPDHVLLLQEFITPADGTIVRTEFVDGEFLFALKVRPVNTFNLCPADGCERPPAAGQSEGDSEPTVDFEHYSDISSDAVAEARAIVQEAGLEVGGVEYIESSDGQRYFFDINAPSVYRPDIVEAAGVDAMTKFVDFIEREYRKELRKRMESLEAIDCNLRLTG
ncbi:MAG: hypothetical protein IH984_09470 [Planctomycetes bacterium]|nr:hypothetical protein [Planctomycetota bacterium]